MHRVSLVLLSLLASCALSCGDYFRGTTLVFEFDRLPVLHKLNPQDAYHPDNNPNGELCAEDAYVAAHKNETDQYGALYQQPYEYHAWATINGAPVRLARFTVRECTVSIEDKEIKMAVTSVSYQRLPPEQLGYAKKPSQWFGVVNSTVSAVPASGAFIDTPVRIDESATEIFVTREPENIADTLGPQGPILMQGKLVPRGEGVYAATLTRVTGVASGAVAAIPADRANAW